MCFVLPSKPQFEHMNGKFHIFHLVTATLGLVDASHTKQTRNDLLRKGWCKFC